MFGAVKETEDIDPDQYGDCGYNIGYDAHSNVSINGEWGKNAILFGTDNSLSVQTNNRKKKRYPGFW